MTVQPSLFGDRDGLTFSPEDDGERLNKQMARVSLVMRDGQWRTLAELAEATGAPEASVSARLRDLRKRKFGGHLVLRRRVRRGLYEYCVIWLDPQAR